MTSNARSPQGEGSVGRVLPGATGGAVSWRQRSLWPLDLVQVRMDVGWLREERRGMFSIEGYVPDTRELLALEVVPLRLYANLEVFLATVREGQAEMLRDLLDPDPF